MVSDKPLAQSPPPYKERAGAPPPRPPKEGRPRGPGGPGNSSARLPPSANIPPARPSASTKPAVQTRQRRSNSDSSVIEPRERERRERREREREHRRERDGEKTTGGSKSKSSKHRTSKKKVHTDTIDKLDVTGIFGPGSFHHDGPFDACNPHRNKNTKRAPVKAFPVDGANMTVNGGSELRGKYATEDQILGRNQDDAYNDFNQASRRNNYTASPRDTDNSGRFDPSVKSDPVHGVATWGLGSTTFLDGAPASRDAIAQSAEEDKVALSRKKSLVQRLRGGNGQGPAVPRRQPPVLRAGDDQIYRTASNPDTTFDKPGVNWGKELAKPRTDEKDAPPAPGGLLRRVKSLKVGRTRRSS